MIFTNLNTLAPIYYNITKSSCLLVYYVRSIVLHYIKNSFNNKYIFILFLNGKYLKSDDIKP